MKRVFFLTILFISPVIYGQQSDSLRLAEHERINVQNQSLIEELAMQLSTQKKSIDSLSDYLSNAVLALKDSLAGVERITAQNKSLIAETRSEVNLLGNATSSLKDDLSLLSTNTKSLIDNNLEAIVELKEEDKTLNQQLVQNTETTNTTFSEIRESVSTIELFWYIIAGLLITSSAGLVFYFNSRIKSGDSLIEKSIHSALSKMDKESLKLDSKLVELLEKQMESFQQELKKNGSTNADIDHSLALKVADEITRMQKNIARLDPNLKGIKPLLKGLERIQDNFAANGYEMPNLVGRNYDERSDMEVLNFIFDENLDKSKKIISRVIKPQVNYGGKLIQRAQIEVTQN